MRNGIRTNMAEIQQAKGDRLIKKDEILPFVTTWMDLEGIMLNEVSHMEKDKYYTISLICGK